MILLTSHFSSKRFLRFDDPQSVFLYEGFCRDRGLAGFPCREANTVVLESSLPELLMKVILRGLDKCGRCSTIMGTGTCTATVFMYVWYIAYVEYIGGYLEGT